MSLPAKPRAVVTGAGSGLGRAFSIELARRGGRILAVDIDLGGAEETARLVVEAGGEASIARCDVAVRSDVEALVALADARLGGVDLLVNNAGVGCAGPVELVPMSDWEWTMGINLWGVIYGCHAFLPRMKAQGRGHILNVASAAGLLTAPEMGPYNVTKAGVIALSETLCGELAGTGVGVTVLCPTFFKTNIAQASRSHGKTPVTAVEGLMKRAKIQAPDVARIALDACGRGQLYVVPHEDGRAMWRMKRLSPERYYQTIMPKLATAARRAAGSTGGVFATLRTLLASD